MGSEETSVPAGIEVTTDFVRHRNALLARGRLSELYLDYYLHLADSGMQIAPEHDAPFKDMIAAFVLHCASRPRNEMIAWTVNLQDPLLNLFTTGDNDLGTVIGRVFTDNVKRADHNVFHCETVRVTRQKVDPARRSVVDFERANIFAAAELFYERSEQRPARFFDLGEERFALLTSHPDCDLGWLRTVTVDDIRGIDTTEELGRIERRHYRWECGCTEERIFRVLTPTMQQDPEGLFQGEDTVCTECPRCGVLYRISRAALEAYIGKHPPTG